MIKKNSYHYFVSSRMKFQWRSFGYKSKVVVLCSVANFINAADRVLMPLAIVPMTNEYKWSLYWQGWILSAFAFGYFTSQVRDVKGRVVLVINLLMNISLKPLHFFDHLKSLKFFQIIGANAVNSYGGRRVLCFAVLLWSLSTVLTPIAAKSLPALICARVILGLGEGLGLPTIFQLFAQHVPAEERSRAFGYMVAAGSVGQTVASLVSTPNIQFMATITYLSIICYVVLLFT